MLFQNIQSWPTPEMFVSSGSPTAIDFEAANAGVYLYFLTTPASTPENENELAKAAIGLSTLSAAAGHVYIPANDETVNAPVLLSTLATPAVINETSDEVSNSSVQLNTLTTPNVSTTTQFDACNSGIMLNTLTA